MEQRAWIAVGQVGMALDEEEVADKGDPILRQEKDGVAGRVPGELQQLGRARRPVEGHVAGEGDVGEANPQDGLGRDDAAVLVDPEGVLTALALVCRRLEACQRRCQGCFCACHDGAQVVDPAGGGDQVACRLGGKDVGLWAKGLVSPDVVVVIVAVDDDIDRAAGQGLGSGPQVLRGVRRHESIKDQRPVAEVDDACIAGGAPAGLVDGGVDAAGQLLEPIVL